MARKVKLVGEHFPTRTAPCGCHEVPDPGPDDCVQCLNTGTLTLPTAYADQAEALGGTVDGDGAHIPCPYCTTKVAFPGLRSEHIEGAWLIEPRSA
jgi:hypothetical protein